MPAPAWRQVNISARRRAQIRRSYSGRLITVLEGGYNLEVLEDCVEDHVRLLLGIPYDHF